jgi:iron complex outermembrane receptor protein
MRKLVWVWLGLLLWAGSVRADGPRDEAKRHFAAGEARFRAGDFRGAIAEFQQADRLVPSPILAYNQALCHDRLGETEPAVRLYRDYLARRPDAPNRAEVEGRIAALEAAPAPPLEEAPTAPPPGAIPPPPAAPEGDGLAAPGAGPRPPAAGPPPPGAPEGDGLARPAPLRRSYGDPFADRPPAGPGGQAEAAPGAPPPGEVPPPQPMPPPPEAPVYKQWWFWAVVGVGAVLVVTVAVDSHSSPTPHVAGSQPGLLLLKF